MEVIICQDSGKASELAAKLLKNQVKKRKHSVLGLATGSTPLTMYKMFIDFVKAEGIVTSEMIAFNLDEYVGVGKDHEGSYAYYMKKNFMEPLDLDPRQLNIPDGMAEDVKKECENYEKRIRQQGPIDLQILGLGQDGHIGFNEPGSSLGSRTRIKSLTEETRDVNRAAFSSLEEVPRHVITMGIQTIMESQKIALMAFGKSKAATVAKMVEGPVSALVPASVLQFHPQVKVFLDEEAASELKNQDYYKQVFAHKPAWQMEEFV